MTRRCGVDAIGGSCGHRGALASCGALIDGDFDIERQAVN
jgi:hypothetical protein